MAWAPAMGWARLSDRTQRGTAAVGGACGASGPRRRSTEADMPGCAGPAASRLERVGRLAWASPKHDCAFAAARQRVTGGCPKRMRWRDERRRAGIKASAAH